MDNRTNLFSRNSTPPNQPPLQHIATSSPPSSIDSLFQNLPQPSADAHDSMSLTDDPNNRSSPNTVTDRQNALLSLIGSSSSAPRPQPPSQSSQPLPQQQQPQQVPTPPGSSQRSNASPPHTDTQKILEQIIGPPIVYSDNQRPNLQYQPDPNPSYQQRDAFRTYDQSTDSSRSQPPQQQQQQNQPPSPRRSFFEFTSAFDHLSSASSVKKKPVPQQPNPNDDPAWSNVLDPKRQSVENLLENLTQHIGPNQPQPPAYEAYLAGGDFSQLDQSPNRPPLPAIPPPKQIVLPNRPTSPIPDPPKLPHPRAQPRPPDLNPSQQSSFSGAVPFPPTNRRDKDGSPGPRAQAPRPRGGAPPPVQSRPNNKSQSSPSPQAQTITFDVSQPLEEIQAKDSVKWTPIALVKQDSIFLPGTTIGATHWVAYAMTRGRVRVISRSSGDRTLLQLPQSFSIPATVIDMAVYGNRLAGVTSDGGFVVWELPELITDDVPGKVSLCVPPTADPSDAIRAVKWHPKDPDVLAVAAEDKIYVIDLANAQGLRGQPLPHSDLHHMGQLFKVSSTVVAFDFDVVHHALATISDDSNLTIWNMHDSRPYAVHKIRGDDVPSSLTFVDGGIVVGRKNGTIFQLLSMTTKTVLSTINFVNGSPDEPEMFGHASYDSRIQTLWVANSRRDSLIALKIHIEPSFDGGEESVRGYIDQVVEFSGIKPTIHFVILTADADPNGKEAHAACVAAKVVPGELALVGFSVHSSGVDQVLIRKEWFDAALMQAESKFPQVDVPASLPVVDSKIQRQPLPLAPAFSQVRSRTPTSDDVENEFSDGRLPEQKKASKGKNVNWKEKEEPTKALKPNDAALINDSSLGQALSREIKKTEESLHSRIGKLIGKEMDKQHQRFEETRLHEQAEDFTRQEKILKLISTELTRNTTRVVEMAVKTEVQNSVLPSLESITRIALNDQIGIGLVDTLNRSLPVEMEKLLLRPNISNHFANIISTTLTPMIERHIKEVLTTTFFQFHSQQTSALHQDLMRELRTEIGAIKSELSNWHNDALRGQETTIRELEHTVRNLSEQVKFLSINPPAPSIHHIQPQPNQNAPGGPALSQQSNQQHLRQPNVPAQNPPVAAYPQTHPSYQTTAPPSQGPIHPGWYSAIAAPQASHPAQLPQASVSQGQPDLTPPLKTDQWDENYLSVLYSQDINKLRDLLARTNPDVVLPLNGSPLVSQAVILTLIHKLSAIVGDTAPTDEMFKTSLWWLQRVSGLLRADDKLIADFIPRVIPTVQQSLTSTKQRLAILPGGLGTMETARNLADIQETLRRKVTQQ